MLTSLLHFLFHAREDPVKDWKTVVVLGWAGKTHYSFIAFGSQLLLMAPPSPLRFQNTERAAGITLRYAPQKYLPY